MADVFALSRRVIKTIQERKLKFNHCQRELLAKTFSHFLDNLETTFRKDHTKDDCLRMCAKALSELWRVMTYADIMVAEWGEEDWWRKVMCSSLSSSLQMHMNQLLQDFIRCLDIAKIAIAEATCDQAFKLPIMDHAQFFATIVDEAYKRDAQSLERDIKAIKKDKTFVQRKFGSSYGLSKYLLRKFHPDTLSSETRRHYSLAFHYLEMTKTSILGSTSGSEFECKCFGMPVLAKCVAVTPGDSDQTLIIKTLEAQVEVLAKLQHVNLVQFIGYAVHENRHHYLVTERVSKSLTTYLTRLGSSSKPMPHLKAFDILLHIAEGMKYLHEQDVVHGALNGSNIMLDATERKKDGFWCVQVKLADYGLSNLLSSSTHHTTSSVITSWKAPELYEKLVSETTVTMDSTSSDMYTKATDVYSFAMTMYEILTGCLKPLEALSAHDVVPSLLAGWRPPVDAKSQCPGYLAAFMNRCWAVNPKDRPPFSDVCNMLSYSRGVILRHSFPSPLSCINEYDAEVLSSHLGTKWCIQEGARGKLPVEVYSYAVFDHVATSRALGGSAKSLSRVDEVEEVMKAGRHFGNWALQACDLEKSFKLFRAVSHNHPEALWRLGLCYEIGMGVATCEIKAMTLYEQARDLNFASAYIDIGHCHASGHGVPKSIDHAKRNWKAALVHQTKAGVPLLAIQELIQNLSAGTSGCTLDSDRVYTTMASRLQELNMHDVGRALLTGPNSCNAPMLDKFPGKQAPAPPVLDHESSPTSNSPDHHPDLNVQVEVGNSSPQSPPQVQYPRLSISQLQQPPPPPRVSQQQQLHQQQLPRIVLLKGGGAGDLQYRLKRRSTSSVHCSSGSSSVMMLVIIAALLCLIAAILVKFFHNNYMASGHARSTTQYQCNIRIDQTAS